MQNTNSISMITAILRGTCGHCPKCGKGKLLASYLKPVQHCAACGEMLGDIRADDGPPWLTILLVGHIVLPMIFTNALHTDWPQGLLMGFWLSVSVVLMGLILPRAKGFFIGILWKNRQAI